MEGKTVKELYDYKDMVDVLNNSLKNSIVMNESMSRLTETAQILSQSMKIINPSLVASMQQIQNIRATEDFSSKLGNMLELQERMQNLFADVAFSESMERMKIAIEQSTRMANVASKALISISPTIKMSAINTIGGRNITNPFTSLEIPKFNGALLDSLQGFSRDTEITIESLTDSIAAHYEAKTEQEIETLSEIQDVSHKKKWSLEEIEYIIALISLILTFYQAVLTSYSEFIIKTAPQNKVNIIQYVNNYYINDGYSADSLNDLRLRLVNMQTLVRQKPDCSSKVKGRLEKGMVVTVTDKYKKWLEVTWTDINGNSYSGWIQNYKTSLFKD